MKLPPVKLLGTIVLCLIIGAVVGIFIPQDGLRATVLELSGSIIPAPEADAHSEEEGGHEEHNHVELSKAAQKSLQLKRLVLTPTSYTSSSVLPAVVVERPAVSDLHVVTEFEGIIEEIKAVPGQAVREGDPLFRIRLTGDSLAKAQSAFLDAILAVDILDQEIKRLADAA